MSDDMPDVIRYRRPRPFNMSYGASAVMTPSHRAEQAYLNRRIRNLVDHVETMKAASAFARLGGQSPKLTRRERARNRLLDYRERVVTAWRVLRGDDIHEDCW